VKRHLPVARANARDFERKTLIARTPQAGTGSNHNG